MSSAATTSRRPGRSRACGPRPTATPLYRTQIRSWTTLDLDPRRGPRDRAGGAPDRRRGAAGDRVGGRRRQPGRVPPAGSRTTPPTRRAPRTSCSTRAREDIDRAMVVAPRFFGPLPRAGCEVKAVEEFKEKDAPFAYYFPPAADGSRGGTYYANGYDLPSRTYTKLATTTYHEAVPGPSLPDRAGEGEPEPAPRSAASARGWSAAPTSRAGGCTASSWPTRWASSAIEAERFGMLDALAWRAARLVVDTGIHALRWTRQRSIDFLLETGLSETDATIETDRYICWPGQALTYMIGLPRDRAAAARARPHATAPASTCASSTTRCSPTARCRSRRSPASCRPGWPPRPEIVAPDGARAGRVTCTDRAERFTMVTNPDHVSALARREIRARLSPATLAQGGRSMIHPAPAPRHARRLAPWRCCRGPRPRRRRPGDRAGQRVRVPHVEPGDARALAPTSRSCRAERRRSGRGLPVRGDPGRDLDRSGRTRRRSTSTSTTRRRPCRSRTTPRPASAWPTSTTPSSSHLVLKRSAGKRPERRVRDPVERELPALLLELPGRAGAGLRSRDPVHQRRSDRHRQPDGDCLAGTSANGSAPEQAGVVVALDIKSGEYRTIYGMGRHNHENWSRFPGYQDAVLLSGDDTFTAPSSQLYSTSLRTPMGLERQGPPLGLRVRQRRDQRLRRPRLSTSTSGHFIDGPGRHRGR